MLYGAMYCFNGAMHMGLCIVVIKSFPKSTSLTELVAECLKQFSSGN